MQREDDESVAQGEGEHSDQADGRHSPATALYSARRH